MSEAEGAAAPAYAPVSSLAPPPSHSLLPFFNPRSVAVVGATDKPGSVGRTLLWNLLSSPFGGTVYAINPKRRNVLGLPSHTSLAALPEKPDLVIIATPANTVPGLVRECVAAGVLAAIIISAGFKETGPAGIALEEEILQVARQGNLRIMGPNCLGLMNPISGLNATFASKPARPGRVGFLSQSGALCTAILDWSARTKVGFSAFVSIGSMLDVEWGDLIQHLGDDPHTQSIVIYMESVGNARSFLSAAREVALTKPIIVLKAGTTDAAAKAAASHTGSLAGSDEVLSAAFRRSGILRVESISSLFYMADVLGKQPRPKGPRLTIVTNAGGPGVLATDALILDGGQLAELSAETLQALDAILPPHWSHGNPIDILGDADPQRYARALEVAARDETSDGLLVTLTPQAMTDPTKTAEALAAVASNSKKPVLAAWMGGEDVQAGADLLNLHNIPTFAYPDTAVRIFNRMWRYSYSLSGLYETPVLDQDSERPTDRQSAEMIIREALDARHTMLPEHASKRILRAYGIPVVSTVVAKDAETAAALAEKMGFPVVVKLYSNTLTHKTDVGGVRLNLADAESVRLAYRSIETSVTEKAGAEHFEGVAVQPMIHHEGYEVILGSSIDAQFGPVLLFGAGGQLVEVIRDRALALPPLNSTLARRMMEQTKIYTALQGVRGRPPVNLAELEQVLVRFSHLVVEQPWIKEIDINPLLASAQGLIALDARVILHDADTQVFPRLAIRPYPTEYVGEWTLRNGAMVTIRPIRPEDEPLITQFHQTLSTDTVYFRYMGSLALEQRIRHDRLTRLCFIDYDRQMALVAEHKDPGTGRREILAVSRLIKLWQGGEAEFGLVVSDGVHGQGLGFEMLRRLIDVGRREGIRRIGSSVLPDNHPMLQLCKKLGFGESRSPGEPVTVTLDLPGAIAP